MWGPPASIYIYNYTLYIYYYYILYSVVGGRRKSEPCSFSLRLPQPGHAIRSYLLLTTVGIALDENRFSLLRSFCSRTNGNPGRKPRRPRTTFLLAFRSPRHSSFSRAVLDRCCRQGKHVTRPLNSDIGCPSPIKKTGLESR